jgi:HAD superfamily hydrolase (TIGR01549 family)
MTTTTATKIQTPELVTFDLYDTLIELHPPRWERLAHACAAIGLETSVEALRNADRYSEDFYTVENGAAPIRDRPKAERDAFRLRHMQVWLEAAGLPHDAETARRARDRYLSEFETPADYRSYRVFSDVLPALDRIRQAGIQTAVISNADKDVTIICAHFEFAGHMDLIVTSALVGWEKPDPRTFQAAYETLGVEPGQALHIGDQPKSDVVGSLGVGMRAALLDRYRRHPDATVPTFATLHELADYVINGTS